MKKIFKWFIKELILLIIGGCVYMGIELAYRGHTHWSMGLVGGISFILIGLINEFFEWDMPLIIQMVIGGSIITTLEFVSGVYLNIIMDLNIWDYSDEPFNLLGQICLRYTVYWYLLSIPAIILDDYIRYYLFGEEKPHYSIV